MTAPVLTAPPSPLPAGDQSQTVFDAAVAAYVQWTALLASELELDAFPWFEGIRDEVAATALSGDLPNFSGQASKLLRINSGATAVGFGPQLPDMRSPSRLIGSAGWNRAVGADRMVSNVFWPTPFTASGVTVTKTATGTDTDGLPYADYSVVGTASATVFFDQIYTSSNSRFASAVGETWTASVLARVISGTAPANCGVKVASRAEIAPTTDAGGANSALFASATEGIVSATFTSTNPSTNQVRGNVFIEVATGSVVNFTVRLKGFQFERAASRTQGQIKELSPTEARDAMGFYITALTTASSFTRTSSTDGAWGPTLTYTRKGNGRCLIIASITAEVSQSGGDDDARGKLKLVAADAAGAYLAANVIGDNTDNIGMANAGANPSFSAQVTVVGDIMPLQATTLNLRYWGSVTADTTPGSVHSLLAQANPTIIVVEYLS